MSHSTDNRAQWPRSAASALVLRDAQVLLVQRAKGAFTGIWSPPGGHIEPGEKAREAAAREVHEETGITAEMVGLLDVHDVIHREAGGALRAHYVLAVFAGRWIAGEPQAASDARTARFWPLGALDSLELTPGARPLIERAAELIARQVR